MKRYIIERHVPGAGKLTPEQLQAIARTSNSVIAVMGKPYKWIESFVTADRLYCIHEAESEKDIMEHASCGDFPVHSIEEVKTMLGPATADAE